MAKLPAHLRKLVDTPAKRKRLDTIIRAAAEREERDMKAKGYYLKGTQWVKYKK